MVRNYSDKWAIEKLEAAKTNFSGDLEALHMEVDDILCELLEMLGYQEVVKIYKDIDKWYA